MKIKLVIPAKGNSNRITKKNLYKINGKSLIYLACEKALMCKTVSAVYVDTESEEIIKEVSCLFKQGLKLIRRPPTLSTNKTNGNMLMLFELGKVDKCDLLIQTFATSPLITSETIDNCINKFINNKNNYDSFFTVLKLQEYLWKDNKPLNFDIDKLPNSFELEEMYMETHGLYGIFTDSLNNYKRRIGKKPMLIEIPQKEALDINNYEDIFLLEKIIGVLNE